MLDAGADFAQALITRGIGRNHTIELVSGFRLLKGMVRVEKLVLLRITILIPAENLFALILERKGETQLRPDTIAIRPDVAHDTESAMFSNSLKDTVDDFRMWFH
jgi:hypothetical protein